MKEVDEIIVDCGAPKTLVGERYLKLYMRKHNLIDADLEKMTCKQRFKFGPSQVYTSTERAKIPIIMKVKDEYIKKIVDAFIIQAEVPFLLGMNTMKQWDTMLDMVSEELFFRTFGITVKCVRNGGSHLIWQFLYIKSMTGPHRKQ